MRAGNFLTLCLYENLYIIIDLINMYISLHNSNILRLFLKINLFILIGG